MRVAYNIPDVFSYKKGGCGAGMTSVGNSSMLSVQAAKIKKLGTFEEGKRQEMRGKLVAYYSDVSHGHAIKSILMHGIDHYREIKTVWDKNQENLVFDIDKLAQHIEEDIANGLIPFFVMGVVGSTPVGGTDNLKELGKICEKNEIYFFVDAAWGGNFTILEEHAYIIDGAEYVDAYVFNPSKFIGSSKESCILYFKNKNDLLNCFHNEKTQDYSLNQLKLGDSTRTALFKVHFLVQTYGISGLKNITKLAIENAKFYEGLISQDERFEFFAKRSLSLVTFRLKLQPGFENQEKLNRQFLEELCKWDRIFIGGGYADGQFFIRLNIWYGNKEAYMRESWSKMQEVANFVLDKK